MSEKKSHRFTWSDYENIYSYYQTAGWADTIRYYGISKSTLQNVIRSMEKEQNILSNHENEKDLLRGKSYDDIRGEILNSLLGELRCNTKLRSISKDNKQRLCKVLFGVDYK